MNVNICPECGKEVSDDAKVCVYCGKSFGDGSDNNFEFDKIKDDSSILSEDTNVENNSLYKKNKTKPIKKTKLIISISGILIILVVISVSIIVIKNKEAQAYEELLMRERADYINKLNTLQSNMLTGAAEAEEMCNLIGKVWYNSIYEERDTETDKYCLIGSYFNDFNTSLEFLFQDDEIIVKLSAIESSQTLVDKDIKDLGTALAGLENCYHDILDLYESFNTLTNLAISPEGNYNSYTSSVRSSANDFLKLNKRLEAQLPN